MDPVFNNCQNDAKTLLTSMELPERSAGLMYKIRDIKNLLETYKTTRKKYDDLVLEHELLQSSFDKFVNENRELLTKEDELSSKLQVLEFAFNDSKTSCEQLVNTQLQIQHENKSHQTTIQQLKNKINKLTEKNRMLKDVDNQEREKMNKTHEDRINELSNEIEILRKEKEQQDVQLMNREIELKGKVKDSIVIELKTQETKQTVVSFDDKETMTDECNNVESEFKQVVIRLMKIKAHMEKKGFYKGAPIKKLFQTILNTKFVKEVNSTVHVNIESEDVECSTQETQTEEQSEIIIPACAINVDVAEEDELFQSYIDKIKDIKIPLFLSPIPEIPKRDSTTQTWCNMLIEKEGSDTYGTEFIDRDVHVSISDNEYDESEAIPQCNDNFIPPSVEFNMKDIKYEPYNRANSNHCMDCPSFNSICVTVLLEICQFTETLKQRMYYVPNDYLEFGETVNNVMNIKCDLIKTKLIGDIVSYLMLQTYKCNMVLNRPIINDKMKTQPFVDPLQNQNIFNVNRKDAVSNSIDAALGQGVCFEYNTRTRNVQNNCKKSIANVGNVLGQQNSSGDYESNSEVLKKQCNIQRNNKNAAANCVCLKEQGRCDSRPASVNSQNNIQKQHNIQQSLNNARNKNSHLFVNQAANENYTPLNSNGVTQLQTEIASLNVESKKFDNIKNLKRKLPNKLKPAGGSEKKIKTHDGSIVPTETKTMNIRKNSNAGVLSAKSSKVQKRKKITNVINSKNNLITSKIIEAVKQQTIYDKTHPLLKPLHIDTDTTSAAKSKTKKSKQKIEASKNSLDNVANIVNLQQDLFLTPTESESSECMLQNINEINNPEPIEKLESNQNNTINNNIKPLGNKTPIKNNLVANELNKLKALEIFKDIKTSKQRLAHNVKSIVVPKDKLCKFKNKRTASKFVKIDEKSDVVPTPEIQTSTSLILEDRTPKMKPVQIQNNCETATVHGSENNSVPEKKLHGGMDLQVEESRIVFSSEGTRSRTVIPTLDSSIFKQDKGKNGSAQIKVLENCIMNYSNKKKANLVIRSMHIAKENQPNKKFNKQICNIISGFLKAPANSFQINLNQCVDKLRALELKDHIDSITSAILGYDMTELVKFINADVKKRLTMPPDYCLSKLIEHLDKVYGYEDKFYNFMLYSIKFKLFRLGRDKNVESMLELVFYTRVYIILLNFKKDVHSLKMYMRDAFYCLTKRAFPVLFELLQAYPHLLAITRASYEENILGLTVKYFVMSYKQQTSFPQIKSVKDLLLRKYKAPFNMTADDMLQVIIKRVKEQPDEDVFWSAILLAKRESLDWTVNQFINKGFFALLQNIYSDKQTLTNGTVPFDNDCRNMKPESIALVIDVLGAVCRTFIEHNHNIALSVIAFLRIILQRNDNSRLVEETIIQSLLRNSRQHYDVTTEILLKWTPNYKPSPYIVHKLKKVMYWESMHYWTLKLRKRS